jgi:hypothetical protein
MSGSIFKQVSRHQPQLVHSASIKPSAGSISSASIRSSSSRASLSPNTSYSSLGSMGSLSRKNSIDDGLRFMSNSRSVDYTHGIDGYGLGHGGIGGLALQRTFSFTSQKSDKDASFKPLNKQIVPKYSEHFTAEPQQFHSMPHAAPLSPSVIGSKHNNDRYGVNNNANNAPTAGYITAPQSNSTTSLHDSLHNGQQIANSRPQSYAGNSLSQSFKNLFSSGSKLNKIPSPQASKPKEGFWNNFGVGGGKLSAWLNSTNTEGFKNNLAQYKENSQSKQELSRQRSNARMDKWINS